MSRPWPRPARPKRRGPTSWRYRVWRRAGIAAASMRPRPSGRWSGLFSLLPAVVDAVRVPVVATGGIADARGVAAALVLGASAAQIGTGYLRCPEAGIDPAWADAIGRTPPEGTMLTRAFSGRAGRSIATDYVRAAACLDAPSPASYPVQRGLTGPMRAAAHREHDVERMQAWAGQSAALSRTMPAEKLTRELWQGARIAVLTRASLSTRICTMRTSMERMFGTLMCLACIVVLCAKLRSRPT